MTGQHPRRIRASSWPGAWSGPWSSRAAGWARARTGWAWGGRPARSEEGSRLYTPNKVLRRHADHLVDHLAEIEALLASAATEPDHWHASAVTLGSDLADFTEADLNE